MSGMLLPTIWDAIGTVVAENIVCGDVSSCRFDKRRSLVVAEFPDAIHA